MGQMVIIIWVTHMKTTIELPDGLLAKARRVARRDGTTLKALIETGLRRALDDRERRQRFVLPDASVGGRGRSKAFADAGWDQIRDAIYVDRGA